MDIENILSVKRKTFPSGDIIYEVTTGDKIINVPASDDNNNFIVISKWEGGANIIEDVSINYGYVTLRAQSYPSVGDQLDASYKDKLNLRKNLVKAQECLDVSNLDGAISSLILALAPVDDSGEIIEEIKKVKEKYPKT